MQTTCGIDEDHVHTLCLGGLDAVKDNGSGVCALVLADDGSAGTTCPDLQLVSCSGTEGIACHQQDLLALAHQLLGDLANGGGLADAVNADDQHHAGGGGQVQGGVAHVQHLHQDVFQRLTGFFRGGQVLAADGLAQSFHSLDGGVDAQIRQDQALFQLVVKVVVDLSKTGEDAAQGVGQCVTGLGQTGFDLVKKSHNVLLYKCFCIYYSTNPRYCSIWFRSSRRRVLTPCSCMVTP